MDPSDLSDRADSDSDETVVAVTQDLSTFKVDHMLSVFIPERVSGCLLSIVRKTRLGTVYAYNIDSLASPKD